MISPNLEYSVLEFKESRPFVSVIIPLYEKEGDQIYNTLWSLDHQDYQGEWEIIVVDDGSSKEIPKYSCKYIRLRPHGVPQRSCSLALWAGLEASTGDFIIECLDDIIVPPDALTKMVQYAYVESRIVPIVYGLPRKATELVDWKSDINAFKDLDSFYSLPTPSGEINLNAHQIKHHIYFSGQTKKWWMNFGFFPKTEEPVTEPLLHVRETQSGILPYQIEDLEVYHQWHTRGEQYSVRMKRIRDA